MEFKSLLSQGMPQLRPRLHPPETHEASATNVHACKPWVFIIGETGNSGCVETMYTRKAWARSP